MKDNAFDIFTGTANPELAEEVSKILKIDIAPADVGYFSDGELNVQIQENVRGHDTFIIQSTCSPTNKNVMEIMLIADALKRSSASKITAIVPYFGYARQDRRVRSARVPISAKVVADMFASVGIDRVLTIDLHSETIQGFFDMPADNVYATKFMVDDIKDNNERDEVVVVSPDVGGVVRARALAKLLDDTDLAIIDKRRAAANQSEVMNIIGDIQGKVCIVPDDIIDTAGTLCNAANALKENGAKAVKAYITHPVLSGPAIERLENSSIDELIVTNSIPLTPDAKKCSKIRVISLANIIAECIKRLSNEESLSEMFL
ncbi:MAG: ribose-phosphate diphosphokinase [SAR86 cluster bacterium SAR86A]|jgi:ribose-phosphate pyrophosphokinase|uniref:Ribose-phosphate pyrophosphokinase n=1 Tax=SAR86 cluster bacterium SAR86A TaxID=1123866 RepID=J4WR77_9GAMM|nr:MAG: ribose-phosphate diphosphokinase [SAR86 cluster bacterium SAR86A]MEC7774302.1 ribose-phosphate pyrophosphokinase [Pseudomonadota bacterium]MEC8131896.1 ribose-phosphate pyrophosphokinase [Pseudomonadota bacterium]|tara:strand:- start:2461 stop:3414 length:954 start_codon:yes stop_codon:yes gene_type:complete